MTIKQIIVMRKDLNMRKGKMVAQGAHASMAGLMQHITCRTAYGTGDHEFSIHMKKDSPLQQWLDGAFTKICVSVNSEEELRAVHLSAQQAGLISALIVDNGQTEFNGVQTPTCCAIGPASADDLHPITGHLPLL